MADCFACYVHEHSWSIVPCAYHVAHRKKTLRTNWEFSEVLFGRNFGLEEMAKLCLIEPFYAFRTTAQLHLAERIIFGGRFHLHHLNTIQQHNRNGHCLAPLVVHCGHSQLHSQSAYTAKSLLSLEFSECGEARVDLVGVVAVGGFKFAIFVVVCKERLLDGQVLKVVDSSGGLKLRLGSSGSLSAFGATREVELLVILDVFQFCLCLELLEGGVVGAQNLHLSPAYQIKYSVSVSIFSAYIAFTLFSCSCSDLDNLAAFSSPAANERANSRSLALGLGLDHLEKAPANLLVIKSIIIIMQHNYIKNESGGSL